MKKFYMSGHWVRAEEDGYFACTVCGEELTEEFIEDCRKNIIANIKHEVDNVVILNIIELKGYGEQ